MINLDNLKNTGRLIRGFDEFLRNWFGKQPVLTVTEWDYEAIETFKKLPDCVFEFHQVVDKWPDSKIVVNNNQDHLHRPPKTRKVWNHEKRDFEVPNINHFALVSENQGNWLVWTSVDKDEYGTLFTDSDLDLNDVYMKMNTPIDEFLVTFGLHELIINNGDWDEDLPNNIQDSTKIFSGNYHADQELSFFYHEEGYLWLAHENSEPWIVYKN